MSDSDQHASSGAPPQKIETGSLTSKLNERVAAWLRRDWLPIALFAVAVLAMTYPLAFQLGQGIPSKSLDTLAAFWQVWWLGEVVQHGYNANFSPYLFHPTGLDVTFQPHPWTALGTWRLLTSLFGDIAGYNLNVMLGLLMSGYATYLLIHTLTGSRVAGWIGGAFYAFYPQHVQRALNQPTTGNIQWFPVMMVALVLCFQGISSSPDERQRLSGRSLVAIILAALALSLNAYISIKPWFQAALLVALYIPLASLIEGWWRSPAFWKALGLLAVCSLLLVLPVLSPYLQAGPGLQSAIERSLDDLRKGADLLSFVRAAPELPILMPRSLAHILGVPFSDYRGRGGVHYLGLISVVLVIAGLVDSFKHHRHRVVWLAMALVFWGLSLGLVLQIDTVEHPDVWTPYRLVKDISVFQAFRNPFRFALGFSLPWAVLVGYGADYLWRRLPSTRWQTWVVVGGLSVLMLFELAIVPLTLHPLGVSPFYDQLGVNYQQGGVIDLPYGTQPSKRYMYLQTIHDNPIVEGKIARMPQGMYKYIKANPLLGAWWNEESPTCDYDLGQAIEDLQVDGFRYVIFHKHILPQYQKPMPYPDWLDDYFANVEPVFEDETILVYTLSDLEAGTPCNPQ